MSEPVVQGPVRKLVVFRMPDDAVPLMSIEELDELRRRTGESLSRGGDPALLVVAPGWSVEVIEGDEVFVQIEAKTRERAELERQWQERFGGGVG